MSNNTLNQYIFIPLKQGKNRTKKSLSKIETKELLRAYTNNALTGNGKLLVLFLFNNSKEMRLTRMHPESWQADTTHGTNNEKKELFTIASLDGNKKAFNVCRAYIPNAQTWIFSLLFNECLPLFLGKTIMTRNRLVVTDGATNEYVPLILATGKESALPYTVHSLCYFHLGVLGWLKHVHPFVTKDMKEKVMLRNAVAKIKSWVKSWFYDTETNIEYLFSRHLFFLWVDSLRGLMSEYFVDSVLKWIKTNLTPYERLWLNHKRLHVQGFNARTTSVGEGMHFSMKNGFDGIRANQSPVTAAGMMMDKSMRNCKEIEIYNAHELDRNRTANNGKRGEYLTDCAFKFAENELKISKSCRAMKVSANEYCVYFPDNGNKEKFLLPRFYRMRRVRHINNKFLTCSCGLSSRMKIPCRHIMSVYDGYDIEMFGLRWLIIYQHAFLNKGFEKLTELFRKMEVEEFSRDNELGETVYVKNFVCNSNSSNYPVKIGSTNEVDVGNMNMMIEAEVQKKVLLRGYDIKEQLRTKQNSEENLDGTLNVCLSQETETMFKNDNSFIEMLQEEQNKECRIIMDSNEAICDEQVLIVREAINAIDNDKVLLDELTTELRELVNKYKLRVTTTKRKGTENNIVFPVTGKCTKKYDKRKGYY